MNRPIRTLSFALAAALALCLPLPLAAQDSTSHRSGDFDYYVLSLSWSPTWCASDGANRGEPQCDRGRRSAFVVHGLWPQYERGWPDYCTTTQRDPTRRESRQMDDIMGSSGLAWYQWKKHGRCSGLSAADYYQAIRDAAASVQIPPLFKMLPRDVRLQASVIEDAFIDMNPQLSRDGITVTCDGERVDEVRICLTRDLRLRDCAPDSRRDCRTRMLMEAPE